MASCLLIVNSWERIPPQFGDPVGTNWDFNRTDRNYITKPLGPMYLKAYLRHRGFECEILDLDTVEDAAKLDLAHDAAAHHDYIGFSCKTSGYPTSLRLASACKVANPNARIVFGGPHATFSYREILHDPCIDFVVRGPGEQGLTALLQGRPLDQIPGLVWRAAADRLVVNPSFGLLPLDSLPFPDRGIQGIQYAYADPEQIYASRGCAYRCRFCVQSRLQPLTFRSPGNVCNELELIRRSGKTRIVFGDTSFLSDRVYARALCAEMQRRALRFESIDIHARVDQLDIEVLCCLRDIGVSHIEIGVESLCPPVLAFLGKTPDAVAYVRRAREVLPWCRSLGFHLDINYLIPVPGQTKKDVLEEFAYLQNYGTVFVYMITPFPGTPLFGRARSRLLVHDWRYFNSEHLVWNESEMSEEDVAEIWRFSRLAERQRTEWLRRHPLERATSS